MPKGKDESNHIAHDGNFGDGRAATEMRRFDVIPDRTGVALISDGRQVRLVAFGSPQPLSLDLNTATIG